MQTSTQGQWILCQDNGPLTYMQIPSLQQSYVVMTCDPCPLLDFLHVTVNGREKGGSSAEPFLSHVSPLFIASCVTNEVGKSCRLKLYILSAPSSVIV